MEIALFFFKPISSVSLLMMYVQNKIADYCRKKETTNVFRLLGETTGSYAMLICCRLSVTFQASYTYTLLFQFLHPGLTMKKVLVSGTRICKLYDFCLAEDATHRVKTIKNKVCIW